MKRIKDESGFVSIVALGMLLMLLTFGIIIQGMTNRTLQNMRNTSAHYHAKDLADSTIEYLRYQLKDKGAGFNLEEFECTREKGTEDAGKTQWDCPITEPSFDADIKITAEIKGRNTPDEKLQDCGNYLGSPNCYVVPALGTGTAGKKCESYTPESESESEYKYASATTKIGPNGKKSTDNLGTNQIDYSCNWNKLTFGSSLTDRATIPFYYVSTELVGGAPGIVSPFNSDTAESGTNKATNFAVRIRPPCKPITENYTEDGIAKKKTTTPTDCSDNDRYVLNSDVDDIVVQWQISGQCDDDDDGKWEECGMMQWAEYEVDEFGNLLVKDYFSGINEGRINKSTGANYPGLENLYNNDTQKANDDNYRLIYPVLYAQDTSDYKNPIRIAEKQLDFGTEALKLPTMRAPILTLFLSNKLISKDGENIPYLEYQVLTDQPIGDSKIKMEVLAEVNENIFKKTVFKEEQKTLIDFAVQN